jgi:hypothetical protein
MNQIFLCTHGRWRGHLLNSIFDLSLVDFSVILYLADNTGMRFLGYCPLTAPETDSVT